MSGRKVAIAGVVLLSSATGFFVSLVAGSRPLPSSTETPLSLKDQAIIQFTKPLVGAPSKTIPAYKEPDSATQSRFNPAQSDSSIVGPDFPSAQANQAPNSLMFVLPDVVSSPPTEFNQSTGPATTIRVRVAVDSTSLSVAGVGLLLLPDGTVFDLGGSVGESLTVSSSQDNLLVGDRFISAGTVLKSPDQGLISVNGRWYRGQIRLVQEAGQLVAVNELDLEQYLYGVVGAEMPAHWNSETLKAQAIAARSCVLALRDRPPSFNWDIGNDEAYQVYRGVETETDTTISAVEATRGNVLLKNNQIFLSQYASTDAISQAAHGGIGNSMSQAGAQLMASQGASTADILARYYSGIELGLIN